MDLTLQIGPQGERVLSNYFGTTYHQPDASYDALNQETRFTYNANRQLTSVQTPSGLTTTNAFFASGSDANRLQQTVDLEISPPTLTPITPTAWFKPTPTSAGSPRRITGTICSGSRSCSTLPSKALGPPSSTPVIAARDGRRRGL